MSSAPSAIQPGYPAWLELLLRYVRHRTDPFCFFDYISIKASTRCAGKAHLGSAASHRPVGEKPEPSSSCFYFLPLENQP
jgi:hypothetical protein